MNCVCGVAQEFQVKLTYYHRRSPKVMLDLWH